MEMHDLSKKVKEIEMPKEMRERIVKNCYMEMENYNMNKTNKTSTNKSFKKYMAAASLAFCVCLTGVTTLAATGKLQGFFKDIKRWDGAIVGTSYEQATDEIDVSVIATSGELIVTVKMLNPTTAPYNSFDTFGIESYEIMDSEGKIVVKGNTDTHINMSSGETSTMSELLDGTAIISIPLENLSTGSYKLLVTEFVGASKADQPLVISGNWECDFIR